MRSRIQPIKTIVPKEFSPEKKITSKQFAFTQTIPRARLVQSPEDRFNHANTEEIKTENTDFNQEQAENAEENKSCEIQKDQNNANENSNESNQQEDSSFNQSENDKNKSILDDEEMISLRSDLSQSHAFSDIDDSTLEYFYQYIKEYIKYTASKEDYEEAKQAKLLSEETLQALYHKKDYRERSDAEKQQFEKSKAKTEGRWQNEIDEFDAITSSKFDELTKRQESERQAFDELWTDEKTLRKYRKPSARLLELWRMEKFLAKQNKFDEATIVHAEAEELAKREFALSQAMVNRDYHNELEKLTEKQESEMEILVNTRKHWREVMISKQQVEKGHISNRESVVELREKEPFRKREAQLPNRQSQSRLKTRSASSLSNPSRSSSKIQTKTSNFQNRRSLNNRPEISFRPYHVLPPLQPPVSSQSNNQESKNEGNSRPSSSLSQSQEIKQ